MPHPAQIFILGNPRSGTTLLRLTLACHPQLAVPAECGFALWLHGRYRDWTLISLPRESSTLGESTEVHVRQVSLGRRRGLTVIS